MNRKLGYIAALIFTGAVACDRSNETFTYRLGKTISDPENSAKQLDVYFGSRGTFFADYGKNGTLDATCTLSKCDILRPFEDPTMQEQIAKQGVPVNLHDRKSATGKALQNEFDTVKTGVRKTGE